MLKKLAIGKYGVCWGNMASLEAIIQDLVDAKFRKEVNAIQARSVHSHTVEENCPNCKESVPFFFYSSAEEVRKVCINCGARFELREQASSWVKLPVRKRMKQLKK